MLSALYLHGVKQGDTQMTIVGLIVAALFFFASQAPPLQELAPKVINIKIKNKHIKFLG